MSCTGSSVAHSTPEATALLAQHPFEHCSERAYAPLAADEESPSWVTGEGL